MDVMAELLPDIVDGERKDMFISDLESELAGASSSAIAELESLVATMKSNEFEAISSIQSLVRDKDDLIEQVRASAPLCHVLKMEVNLKQTIIETIAKVDAATDRVFKVTSKWTKEVRTIFLGSSLLDALTPQNFKEQIQEAKQMIFVAFLLGVGTFYWSLVIQR